MDVCCHGRPRALRGGGVAVTEEWRPVAEWEGLYEVSSDGRVQSLPRRRQRGRAGAGMVSGRVLRPHVDKDGYRIVTLRDRTRVARARVHRLVAIAFLPNPFNLPLVLHWDDDPANNSVGNLRWGDDSQNMHDRVRNGTHNNAMKTHCPRGHALVGNNLVPSQLRRGARQCRACQKEHLRAWRLGSPFLKQRADANFALFMGQVNAHE